MAVIIVSVVEHVTGLNTEDLAQFPAQHMLAIIVKPVV